MCVFFFSIWILRNFLVRDNLQDSLLNKKVIKKSYISDAIYKYTTSTHIWVKKTCYNIISYSLESTWKMETSN